MTPAGPARARPATGELVSLAERASYLRALRAGFAAIVLILCAAAPGVRGVPFRDVAIATAAYSILLPLPEVTRRLSRERLMALIGGSLLLDGVYLGWVTYATGGAQSPLRFLVFVHVVAVTLLASYRTGLKIAAWHSLIWLLAFYAQSANFLEVRETIVSALPGRGDTFQLVSMLNIGALWVVALATATFSAVNERELRAQKVDLEEIGGMVTEIDQRTAAGEIPDIVLEKVCRVFGFLRGAVVASPPNRESFALMGYRGPGRPPVREGLDPAMERAWASRTTQLVRSLDPGTDPRLATLLPGARNVLIVPLFIEGGYRMGVMVLEWGERSAHIKRWILAMVEQCAAHTALAMHNAWLLEEVQTKLDAIRGLEMELFAQNIALESTVTERTQELRESLDALQLVDAQRRKLLSRVVKAEEEERRRIARDVHDGPVQQLVALGMQLERLRDRFEALDREETRTTLDRSVGKIRSSIEVMRTLIYELRPRVLDEEGLAAAVARLAEDLDPGVQASVDNLLREEPSEEVRLTLYRIVQEALMNVRKHARATNVRVRLESRDAGFLVRIQDDGVGLSPEALHSADGHLGLTSMRERAEMAGGRCEVRSLPQGGTTVEFWVPANGATPPPATLPQSDGSVQSEPAAAAM